MQNLFRGILYIGCWFFLILPQVSADADSAAGDGEDHHHDVGRVRPRGGAGNFFFPEQDEEPVVLHHDPRVFPELRSDETLCDPSSEAGGGYEIRIELLFSENGRTTSTSTTGGSGTTTTRIHHAEATFGNNEKLAIYVPAAARAGDEDDEQEKILRLLQSLVFEESNGADAIQLFCEVIEKKIRQTPTIVIPGGTQQDLDDGFYHQHYNHAMNDFSIDWLSRKRAIELLSSWLPPLPAETALPGSVVDDENSHYYLLSAEGRFCGTICRAQEENTIEGVVASTAWFSSPDEERNIVRPLQEQEHQEEERLWKKINELMIAKRELDVTLPSTSMDGYSIRRLQVNDPALSNCTGDALLTARTKFSVTLVMLLDSKQGELLFEDDQQLVGSLFQSSYEVVNALNPALCDPYGRIVTETKVFGPGTEASIYNLDPYDPDFVAVGVTVVGSCDHCTEGQAVLPPRLFQRRFNEMVVVSTNTSLCTTCPANVTQRLPTEEEFQTVFGAALVEAGIIVESSDLKAIVPQTTVACAAERVPFTCRVLVGLEDLSNCTLPLEEFDEGQLAGAFHRAYNRLAYDSFCDPYHRILDDAVVVNQDTSVSEDGTFTFELQVSGTLQCPDGATACDANEIGLYYDPSAVAYSETSGNRRRDLQSSVCGCPAYAISDRGPTEPEVLVEFRSQVQRVLDDLGCSSMQVSECEDFGTLFRSGLQITFANASAALQTSEALIEASARAAMMSLFGLDGNSTACDPEFHVFENFRFVFVGGRRSLETMEFIPNDDRPTDGRVLQDSASPVPVPAPTTKTPTSSPTSSSMPTRLFQGASTTSQSPSALFTVSGNLVISGTCNGCANELFASNQVSGRLLEQEPPLRNLEQSPRDLQAYFSVRSNCFCPIGSNVIEFKPSIGMFEAALEELLGLEISELLQIDVGEETVLEESYSYTCTDSMTSFRKNITVELQYTCLGGTPTLTLDEQAAIASAYVAAYNSQRDMVCDPLSIEMSSARVLEVGDLRLNGTSIPLAIEVIVNCFGCDPLATDIYGFPEENGAVNWLDINRRLVQQSAGFSKTRRRRVQQAGICECDPALPRRPPLETNVTAAMNPALQSLGLLCFGNTSECNFGAPFRTNMLLEVQFGEQDPLTGAQNLQTAYTNALNGLVNGGNDTHCNPNFGVVTSSEFFFDLVYNSVSVGSNTTNVPSRSLFRGLQAVGGNEIFDLDNVLSGGTANLSQTPSAAPTTISNAADSSTSSPQNASQMILLQASGVCNGCPTELFLGDQTSARRDLGGEDLSNEASFHSEHRFLQVLSGEQLESESECFCPIESMIIQSNFDLSMFLQNFQNELAKFDNQTTIVTESVQVGVRQLACEAQSSFSSELVFEFSAFEWVTQNLDHVQGLGTEIAAIYNSLVTEFCDQHFRNSITLTLDTSSVERTSTPTNGRLLQQGCFNYKARFLVSGLCRGCSSLGNPIPIFGQHSTGNGRSLEEEVVSMAQDRWQTRQESTALERQLQEYGASMCVCDSSAARRQGAPSLTAVQQQLGLLIPTQLPWQMYPSICGLPVGTEVPCPILPTADSLVVELTLYVQLANGGCVTSVELDEIAQAYMESFNDEMQLTRFTCEPSYLQITNITPDYSLVRACGRRNMLRKKSRTLIQDVTPVPLTMVVWGGFLAAGNMVKIVINDSGSFNQAGTGVEVKTNGKYYVMFDGSSSPSAFPSAFPSQFPSQFPSAYPSSAPSPEPSAPPSPLPTPEPSAPPSPLPTPEPSAPPSPVPTPKPSAPPSPLPTLEPSSAPTKCTDFVDLLGQAGNDFRSWGDAVFPSFDPLFSHCPITASSYDVFKYDQATQLYMNVDPTAAFPVTIVKVDNELDKVCNDGFCFTTGNSCNDSCCGPFSYSATDIIMVSDTGGAVYRLHDGSAPCFDGTVFPKRDGVALCSSGCTYTADPVTCIANGGYPDYMWFYIPNSISIPGATVRVVLSGDQFKMSVFNKPGAGAVEDSPCPQSGDLVGTATATSGSPAMVIISGDVIVGVNKLGSTSNFDLTITVVL